MKIQTTRFGEIEVIQDMVFTFESPIIGYDDLKSFMLIEHNEKSCFKWLQSVEKPDIAFPITSTSFFGIDYTFEIEDDDAGKIDLTKAEDLLVLNIASIPSSNPKNTTLNLRAPIIVNSQNLKSMQIILKDDKFPIKYPLFNAVNNAAEEKEG